MAACGFRENALAIFPAPNQFNFPLRDCDTPLFPAEDDVPPEVPLAEDDEIGPILAPVSNCVLALPLALDGLAVDTPLFPAEDDVPPEVPLAEDDEIGPILAPVSNCVLALPLALDGLAVDTPLFPAEDDVPPEVFR